MDVTIYLADACAHDAWAKGTNTTDSRTSAANGDPQASCVKCLLCANMAGTALWLCLLLADAFLLHHESMLVDQQ